MERVTSMLYPCQLREAGSEFLETRLWRRGLIWEASVVRLGCSFSSPHSSFSHLALRRRRQRSVSPTGKRSRAPKTKIRLLYLAKKTSAFRHPRRPNSARKTRQE